MVAKQPLPNGRGSDNFRSRGSEATLPYGRGSDNFVEIRDLIGERLLHWGHSRAALTEREALLGV